MLKNLNLKYRILLGYCVPLLLFIAVIAIIYGNMKRLEDHLSIVESTHSIVGDIKEMMFNIAKMQKAVRGYLLMKNERSLKTYEETEKEYKDLAQSLQAKVKDSKQQESLLKFNDLAGQLYANARELVSLVNTGKPDKALESFRTGFTVNWATNLDSIGQEFEKRENELLLERQKEKDLAMRFALQVTVAGSLLAVVLAVIIGLWVSSRISWTICETTNVLSSTSTEIASTVDQHERTASRQAFVVNETTATVEELGASSRQSAEQAASAAEVAQKASVLTEEGKEAVRRVIEGMKVLKNKVGSIADQILRLGEQTDQIGNIANLVKDLAGETNMLALNAAVEAARAGEHGKGFAVVASEVRKLADQSKKSAEQANVLIADIQKATSATIMVTEEGAKTVDEVTNLAQKLGELLSTLSGAADSVYENARQVLLNATQQSAALGQVVEAVNTINRNAKETAAGITQTKIGMENLTKAAQKLQELI